jgi:hypothetical protein
MHSSITSIIDHEFVSQEVVYEVCGVFACFFAQQQQKDLQESFRPQQESKNITKIST